jgi:CRISPR/Cas system CSM-associated protein Csm3 (group 7 of RAMP superfamily)
VSIRWIQVELLGPWHISSGHGAGPTADSTVIRSAGGLPYLPGRTLRGLLRDGLQRAEDLGRVEKGRTAELFGTWSFERDSQGKPLHTRRDTDPGKLFVDSATLSADFEHYAATDPVWAEAFISTVATTALEGGVALDHTLRTVEVAIPMTLSARLEGPEDDSTWPSDLERALPWIRGLGLMRSRGYGRVSMSLQPQVVASA